MGGVGRLQVQKTLVDSNRRILIGGLFQGVKPIRELNWQPLQVSPSTIECVLLTNGHLDHCGWLHWLIKDFQVKLL
jgi:metallo-beta-lactamase family protein